MPYGEPFAPPPYGGGMPMSPFAPPMPPGGGFGPPPYGMMMPPPGGMMPPPEGMMPPPGFGDPVGFLIPGLLRAIGGIFGGGRPPPPPPPPPMAMQPNLPPLPELFYSNRPEFCRVYCPPMPGMMPGMMSPAAPGGGGGRRRRRHHRLSGLGDPVGALPLLAMLAPLAMQVLPGLIQGLTKGGGLSGYYGEPPYPHGYNGW